MGVLLKFILFAVVIYYILRKVGGLMYRIMGGKPPVNTRQQYKRKGEVNVEYDPRKKNKKFDSDFEGGEYVDYEEIK